MPDKDVGEMLRGMIENDEDYTRLRVHKIRSELARKAVRAAFYLAGKLYEILPPEKADGLTAAADLEGLRLACYKCGIDPVDMPRQGGRAK